jgi:hypothetical protein
MPQDRVAVPDRKLRRLEHLLGAEDARLEVILVGTQPGLFLAEMAKTVVADVERRGQLLHVDRFVAASAEDEAGPIVLIPARAARSGQSRRLRSKGYNTTPLAPGASVDAVAANAVLVANAAVAARNWRRETGLM